MVEADQRSLFEAAVVARLKESGFLEVEIRIECLVRCDDGYQDEVINAGWHYWNAAIAVNAAHIQSNKPSPGNETITGETVRGEPCQLPPPEPRPSPWIHDELEILSRLVAGDTIVFSSDGEMAWFSKGDNAFVGDAIIDLRKQGFLSRQNDEEEDPRGLADYDTISEAGREALAVHTKETGQ